MRALWLKLHRWSGLSAGLFLFLAGLTGAVLAFHEELDAALNPHLFRVEPRGNALSAVELRDIAQRGESRATVDYVDLHRAPDESAVFFLSPKADPASGEPYDLPYDQLFVDPYSGERLGQRLEAGVGLERQQLLPTIFWFHRKLLLPSPWGEWLTGAVALVWVCNCFVGFYLTLPQRRKRFVSAWKQAWRVRPMQSITQLSFDLHRASGLWLWVMLLVIAVSAVRLNLHEEVFRPVAGMVLPFHPAPAVSSGEGHAAAATEMGWQEALERGRVLMREHARRDGFDVEHEASLTLDRDAGVFTYAVRSSFDIRQQGGDTQVYFSAFDGGELAFFHPALASGDALELWLEVLHRSHIWGLPYQVFMSVMGVVVAMLALTGAVVWFKRRRRRPVPATSVPVS